MIYVCVRQMADRLVKREYNYEIKLTFAPTLAQSNFRALSLSKLDPRDLIK